MSAAPARGGLPFWVWMGLAVVALAAALLLLLARSELPATRLPDRRAPPAASATPPEPQAPAPHPARNRPEAARPPTGEPEPPEPVPGRTGIRGVVLDPEGAPIEDARILYQRRLERGRIREGLPGRTDGDGRFACPLETTGTLEVLAEHSKYAASAPVRVSVRRGEWIEGISLRLRAGLALSGLVVDQADRPLDGVEVKAVRAGAVGPPGERIYQTRSTVTGADGAFRFGRLARSDAFTLLAERRGYFAPPWGQETDVHRAGESGVRLVLLAGAVLSGRVLQPDRRGVARASVALEPCEDASAASGPPSTGEREFLERTWQRTSTSAEDGQYRVEGLPDGCWRVFCRADGFSSPPPVEVWLAAGEERSGFDLVLGTGCTVTGEVRLATGAPVRGITVRARSRGSEAWTVTTRTGLRGEFSLDLEGPGEHELTVSVRGYMPAPGQELPLPVRAGDHVTVLLVRLEAIRGQVVDATGAPVKRFRVGLARGAMVRTRGFASEDGRFELRPDTEKPVEAVIITVEGHPPVRVPVTSHQPPAGLELGIIVVG